MNATEGHAQTKSNPHEIGATSTPEAHVYAHCLDCGNNAPYSVNQTTCPVCQGTWFEASYQALRQPELLLNALPSRPFDLWRYLEVLPVKSRPTSLSMGEGGTPLYRAVNLGLMLGLPNIFIKDERQGPTASFKDRQAAMSIAALKEAGITEMVLASTGNVAISYSAYAARAGIKLWAFLTSLVPSEKMREVAIYGTEVVKVTASYDEAKKLAAEFARQRGLYLERGARSIPSIEAMKTIAYEIAEQLSWEDMQPLQGTASHFRTRWVAPDWYFQSISGGLGPLGVLKGFRELKQMGLIERIPALGGIQAEGCSPMVAAWHKGLDVAEPIRVPRTHISTLATGDPGRTYTLLRQGMLQGGGGVFESVSDEETFHTMHILAKMEGISVEPAAAVAFAGLIQMARAGRIRPQEIIVVNCTGHTMPIESSILGEGWSRNVSLPEHLREQTPEEGLLAALNRVTADRYPNILIVDDHEDARRLLRRILQSQGKFSLFEAENGHQALQLAQRHLPDLILLDLMMPEMDGFAFLDTLKANPSTANIPVIIVTAKELTSDEKNKLAGMVLMQKGEFLTDEILEEIRALLK